MKNKSPMISEKIIKVISMLLEYKGCVMSYDNENKNALSVAYEISDLKCFHCLLNFNEKLEIFSNIAIKKLLYSMIDKKDWLNIKLLLEKAVPNKYEDKFILYLADRFIKENQLELACLAIKQCTDKNFIYKNDETFLTKLIKEGYQESIIIELIQMNYFDINQKNKENQTVLSLAKDKSLLNLVKIVSQMDQTSSNETSQLIKKTGIENASKSLTEKNQIKIPQINFYKKEIPIKDRIFKEIDINQTVKYYHQTQFGVIDFFGKVLWTGIDKHGTYYYGLELDDDWPNATDGAFGGQRLFQCKPHRGVLADIRNVIFVTRVKKQEPEKIEMISSKSSSCLVLSSSFPLNEGIKNGIQGNISTSLFDSLLYALFVKCETLDYIINPLTNDMEINEVTTRFRSVLAFQVIYSLRQYGYVSFDKLEEIRSILQDYGNNYENFIKESNIDNCLGYISKLCPGEKLLSLISYNNYKSNVMYIQLLGRFSEFVLNVNSQEILNMSMVNNEIMFNTLPSCLILSIPMDNRQELDAIDFIPLNVIDISQVCIVYFKKCKLCVNRATRQCRQCIEKSNFIIKNGFYCDNHQCSHQEMLKLPLINISSRSQSKLFLKSIICFDKYKYVAFVKEDELRNRWFRFDNCSSDKDINNYNSIPKVTFSEDVTNFFNLSDKEMIDNSASYHRSDAKLILRQAHVLIYNNSMMSCY